jgi:adenosylhomocysteine nucleosidase
MISFYNPRRFMFVRQLVNAWLRQAAQEKLREAVSEGARAVSKANPQSDGGQETESAPLPCEAAFIFALGVESGGLVDRLEDMVRRRYKTRTEYDGLLQGRRVLAINSGVGIEAADRATEKVISRHHPEWIVSAGFAGALREELRRGHIVMANSVADLSGRELEIGLRMDPQAIAATRGLHVGRLLTVDHILRSPEEKRSLAEKHQALACDMETIAVAEACRRNKVRFLSVRVISDGLDDALPPELESLVNQKSSAARLGAAAGALFRRPGSVKDMWRLKEEAIKASDRLAKFLESVFGQLEKSPPSQ